MNEFELKNASFETFILESLARLGHAISPPPRTTAAESSFTGSRTYSLLQGTKQELDVPEANNNFYYLHVHEAFWTETDQGWCPEKWDEAETSESLAEVRPRWGVDVPRESRLFDPSAYIFSCLQRFIFLADIDLAVYF